MLLWKMLLVVAALKGHKALAQPAGGGVREIGRQTLTGRFAGMEASLVEVSYPPGGRSAEHRHPVFIAGYVLEGRIRFREAVRASERKRWPSFTTQGGGR